MQLFATVPTMDSLVRRLIQFLKLLGFDIYEQAKSTRRLALMVSLVLFSLYSHLSSVYEQPNEKLFGVTLVLTVCVVNVRVDFSRAPY